MDGGHLHGFEVYFRLQALVGYGVIALRYPVCRPGITTPPTSAAPWQVVVGLVVWTLAPWIQLA